MTKFIGTNFPDDEHREFSVLAAKRGLSKAALMRQLVQSFIKKDEASDARRRHSKKEGGAR